MKKRIVIGAITVTMPSSLAGRCLRRRRVPRRGRRGAQPRQDGSRPQRGELDHRRASPHARNPSRRCTREHSDGPHGVPEDDRTPGSASQSSSREYRGPRHGDHTYLGATGSRAVPHRRPRHARCHAQPVQPGTPAKRGAPHRTHRDHVPRQLDGRITATFFDEKAASWRQEQDKLQARITELRHQTKNYDDAITTVEKIGNLCKEFPNQPAGEQRRLLGIIIDNAT